MKNLNNFQIAEVQSQVLLSICLFFFANISLAMLIKVLLIKKEWELSIHISSPRVGGSENITSYSILSTWSDLSCGRFVSLCNSLVLFSKISTGADDRVQLPQHWPLDPFLEIFYKKGVLKNFANFTRKHLCHNPLFNKVAGLRPWTLLK